MIRFVGLILLLLGILYIGLKPNNSSKILDNLGKSAVIALDPNNNGSTADKTAEGKVTPGCERVVLNLEPDESQTFVRNVHCRNLDWYREDGPSIAVAFSGTDGMHSYQWESGKKVPPYDGIVESVSLYNLGEKAVLVEFFYRH